MENHGITNIKKTLLVIIKLSMAFEKIKWNWRTILFKVIPLLIKYRKQLIGIYEKRSEILLELQDLSGFERLDINLFIGAELDLQNDTVEKVIKEGIDLIVVLGDKFEFIKNVIRNGKKEQVLGR